MRRVIIFQSERFTVVSYGSGISYALHNHPAKKSVFFQNDAANEFRAEVEAWEAIDPDRPYDEIYQEIWNEYESIAQMTA